MNNTSTKGILSHSKASWRQQSAGGVCEPSPSSMTKSPALEAGDFVIERGQHLRAAV